MTISRLIILLTLLLGGLSSVFFLPQQLGFAPVGISLQLPETLGEWWGNHVEVGQKERDVLGPETEFSRKEYSNGRGDLLLASIVLSGEDMMTGIHRPERCLAAQGWSFEPGDDREIDVPGKGKIPVKRLKTHRVERLADGRPVSIENICYYWFAGSRDLTEEHLRRVWIDSRDRLAGGYAQRWAMMMVASNITSSRQKFGRDEKATDELITGFIQRLAPSLHKESIAYR
jgi:EpsI family protein